jgi:uncharacterized protein YceH (UPF0502 family)
MENIELSEIEVRVLGSLVEKETATPEYYPLSLHGVTGACNQKSNREPVMSLEEDAVHAALESLRAKGLSLHISGGDHRVSKYAHRLGEVFNFDRREQMLLCVLMLRGPQTIGELRGRTERLYNFDSLADVESALGRLAERTPLLVKKLPRRPGEKEPRYAHLLSGDVVSTEPLAPPRPAPLEARVAQLESEIADLKRQFDDFRKSFE